MRLVLPALASTWIALLGCGGRAIGGVDRSLGPAHDTLVVVDQPGDTAHDVDGGGSDAQADAQVGDVAGDAHYFYPSMLGVTIADGGELTVSNPVIEACFKIAACGGVAGSGPDTNLDDCIVSAMVPGKRRDFVREQIMVSRVPCLAEARTCAEVKACINPFHSAIDCSAGLNRCDGDVWVSCVGNGQPLPTSADCTLFGLKCVSSSQTFIAYCGYETCDAGVPQCYGNVASFCSGGILMPKDDCTRLGLACGDGADGTKQCIGSGATCPAGTQTTCNGTRSQWCAGGMLAEVDCSAFGLDCYGPDICGFSLEEPPPGGRCSVAGSGPPGSGYQASCAGSVAKFCLEDSFGGEVGQVVEFDCKKLSPQATCLVKLESAVCTLP